MHRAIINGFHEKFHEQVIRELIGVLGISYCEYIGTGDAFRLPAQVRLHYFGAISWGSYDVDWNKIEPLDSQIITEMRECEAVVLKMMDRLELSRHLEYADRKRIYLRHLRYWNDTLKRNNIDVFISSNIPHENYDYVIYCLCKRMGIKTVLLHQGPIRDTFFAFQDWTEFVVDIRKIFCALKNRDQEKSSLALSPRFEEHLRVMTRGEKNPALFYMESSSGGKKKRVYRAFRRVLQESKKLVRFPRTIARFAVMLFFSGSRNSIHRLSGSLLSRCLGLAKARQNRETDLFYQKNSIAPDLGRKYVYFPLHYQPELTSSPLGGAFVDQLLIAQMLSASLPESFLIFVKEHPKQHALARDTIFYQDLLDIPRVRLIKKQSDSRALIGSSRAVATISGTAGWEALFLEKPVLLFGNFFYQYADGVHIIRSLRDCKEAITSIVAAKDMHSVESMRLFLKAVESCSYEGYVDGAYSVISEVSEGKCAEAIIKAVRVIAES